MLHGRHKTMIAPLPIHHGPGPVAQPHPAALPITLPPHATGDSAVSDLGNPGPLLHTVGPAIERAKHAPMPPGEARPAGSFVTSIAGVQLIFQHEAQKGVSNHLYWPRGASGVTLGAGYDMKERSSTTIASDLARIGVDPDTAARVGKASGLQNEAAESFARHNKALVDLSHEQETALLRLILTHYEGMVHKAVTKSILQHEFDALVSYAYNPGGGWHRVTTLINGDKPHEAMLELSKHVVSRHQIVRSLVHRRAAEVRLYIYGEYT